ncbi:flagellin [Candidatus Dependentiae bacterium]|nr:flagellin [Candidatus Dependentiae bacterium]
MESGLRIQHNVSAMYAHRQLTLTNFRINSSLEKLSSGYRINRAADDAAGLAISEKLRTQINGLDQASRNIQDGISLIQTAESGLEELHSILQRMRVLAVQSANDTLIDSDREFIQLEITQLLCEIDRMQTGVQFNTKYLLNGSYGIDRATGNPGSLVFHVGANINQTYSVHISSFSTTGMNIDTLGDGTTAFTVATRAEAESAIALLSSAINQISEQRAQLGAIQNRLEHTYNFVLIAKENLQSAESRIRDVDLAAEMVNFTKEQILMQAGQAMLTQANLRPQSVLQMLG